MSSKKEFLQITDLKDMLNKTKEVYGDLPAYKIRDKIKKGKYKIITHKETREMIENLLKDKPIKSISLDNGSEFSEFKLLEEHLKTEVYFAEPHKPWQRGTNENTNDILRFFFPKGYNFHTLSNEFLQSIVLSINLRPKKCLGWRSPFEAFFGVALA